MTKKKIKFEEAMNRLEEIIEDMESGDLSLEESIKNYTEATELTKFCETKLGEFEQKVECLAKKDETVGWHDFPDTSEQE